MKQDHHTQGSDAVDSLLPINENAGSNHLSGLNSTSENTSRKTVRIGEAIFGGKSFIVIAGPCAVETPDQIRNAALLVSAAGARVLRGGTFKARTSPYDFQGLGLEGVKMMREAADAAGLPMITEVLSQHDLAEMEPYVDAFQVGSRNMDNTALLKDLGMLRKPILLKRGFGATVREWLLAAEYLLLGGNEDVILCERGIRTFSNETRFTLDLAGAVLAHQLTAAPVIVDPSHATGNPCLIPAMAAATAAAGLDGLMVEVHPDPTHALSDARQALSPENFRALMRRVRTIAEAAGREL